MFNSLKTSVFSLLEPKNSAPIKYVNYNCEVCMKDKNAIPNMGGRFFLVGNMYCQCNGCGTIYDKKDKYVYACM